MLLSLPVISVSLAGCKSGGSRGWQTQRRGVGGTEKVNLDPSPSFYTGGNQTGKLAGEHAVMNSHDFESCVIFFKCRDKAL